MPRWRPESVGREIREVLSDLVQNRLKDPSLGFVTVTAVKVSQDIRYAKVFVSVMGDEAARTGSLEALDRAKAFLRRELSQAIRLRYTPELSFAYDDSIERGARINQLLDGLRAEEP
jgi:ribosome-binding factor A